jgi:hypothetical protein
MSRKKEVTPEKKSKLVCGKMNESKGQGGEN